MVKSMNNEIAFPEPDWKTLPQQDILYFKHKFLDSTPWDLLVAYWGIVVSKEGSIWGATRLECERTPVYPCYPGAVMREWRKMVKETVSNKGEGR